MKANKNQQQGLTEINLTSLVDVALTLVIIFMVASPFIMQSGIKVKAPSVEQTEEIDIQRQMEAEIFVRANGTMLLNGRVVKPQAFADSLRVLLSRSNNHKVLIAADDDVLHDQVIAVLDQARQLGARDLSIVRAE